MAQTGPEPNSSQLIPSTLSVATLFTRDPHVGITYISMTRGSSKQFPVPQEVLFPCHRGQYRILVFLQPSKASWQLLCACKSLLIRRSPASGTVFACLAGVVIRGKAAAASVSDGECRPRQDEEEGEEEHVKEEKDEGEHVEEEEMRGGG